MKLQKGVWYAGICRGRTNFGNYQGSTNGYLVFNDSPFCNDYGKMVEGIPINEIGDWTFIPMDVKPNVLPTEVSAFEIVRAALDS